MNQTVIIPVILCGGSGTRLWPASRENLPKQFLKLMDDFSLLQNTMKRALRVADARAEHLVTVTLGTLADEVRNQLSEINPLAARHVLSESSARNTAAAVAYAAAYVRDQFGANSIMWILPADHHIGDENDLTLAFSNGLAAAKDGNLVTFGIRPTRPDTGYGYIRLGAAMDQYQSVSKADAFVEKPSRDIAQSYLDAGNYFWNSGMFLFSAQSVLDHFADLSPAILSGVEESLRTAPHPSMPAANIYDAIEKQPFDTAIMEKSSRVAIVPCDPEWSDIGSWESLWDIRTKDMNGNVIEGRAACHDTKNCLIQGKDRLIACAGLENIVVIETEDAILIADRSNSDAMKVIVNGLRKSGCREVMDPPSSGQSWTLNKTVGEGPSYDVREMMMRAGESLSMKGQIHDNKFWTVLSGNALVTIGGVAKSVSAEETIFIPSGVDYTVANNSEEDLKLVEVSHQQKDTVKIVTPLRKEAA